MRQVGFEDLPRLMTNSIPCQSSVTYQVGGSLPNSAHTYVERRADTTLFNSLIAGEFCYVLNARQMGKSSLRVQVMQRLLQAGVACAAVDITKIGSQNINSEQWYASLIGALVQGFELGDRFQLRAWWRERQYLAPVQRLGEFIETVLLELLPMPLVVFIDEIDSLLSLPFATDDFFTWMRACYNQRVDNSAFNRLTFALLGVTTPANLIQDKQRTPFNIGQAIPLEGLTLPAAAPLAEGLRHLSPNPETVLQAILDWTGGQPFLTQKLCRLAQQHLSEPIPLGQEQQVISQLIQARVLTDWEHYDEPEHLKTIRNRILVNEQRAGRLLGLYQQLLHIGTIPADDTNEQIELRLTGLVTYDQGQLRVFNPIYENVFDLAWVEFQLAQLRPYGVLLQAWFESACTDTSRLLRGESLKEALAWATDKSLSDQDYQFLAASQDWQQQETQRTLLIERQEKETMAAANRILSRASQKAKRLVFFAGIGLGIVSIFAVIVGTGLVKTSQELQNSEASLALEQESINILAQFPAQPLSSLVAAINNGRELYDLIGNAPLSQYPTTRPILTLNSILNDILARNRWEIADQLVGSSITKDGSVLTVLANGTVQLWNAQGQKQAEFHLSDQPLTGMRYDWQSEQLAILNRSGQGEVWHIQARPQKQFNLAGLSSSLVSFKFSPNHQTMAGISPSGRVYVWDQRGQLLADFRAHRPVGYSLAYTPDGQTLATSGNDGLVRLWGLDGSLRQAWPAGITQAVKPKSLVFVDPETLAGVSDDGILRIWNRQGEQINQWRVSITPSYLVAVSPNGQTLLTLSEDNIIRLWTTNGLLEAELSGHERFVTHVDFNPAQQRLVSNDRNGRLFIWDFQPRDQIWAARQSSVWNAVFNPAGTELATAGKNGTIKVWTRSGHLLHTHQASGSGINSLAFVPDQNTLLFGGDDGRVGMWAIPEKKIIPLRPAGSGIYTVAVAPQGQVLAAAGQEGKIFVWFQTRTSGQSFGSPLTIAGHQGAVWSLSFLPRAAQAEFGQGPILISTGQDGWVRLWDTQTGNLVRAINPKQGWLTSLRMAPDGQTFIVGGEGGVISQWELSGRRVRQFKGHLSSILSLALSQDGEMIASVAQDGIVNVWALSGQPLASFRSESGTIYSLDISPLPEQQLVIVGQADIVHLEPLYRLPDLLAKGCQWLQDYRVTHADAQAMCLTLAPSP